MNEIASYILKKYGYKLTEAELNTVIQWYENNKRTIVTEDVLDSKLRTFLISTFPNKVITLYDEDTSNMSYLLSLLKNRNQ